MLHTGSLLQFPFGAANSFSPSATDSKWNIDSLFPPSPAGGGGGGSPLFQDVNWSAMQPPPLWLAPSGGVQSSLDGSCIESGEGLSSPMTGFEDAISGMQAQRESEIGPGLKMFCAEGITSSSVTLDAMDTMMPGVDTGHEQQQQEVMFDQLVEETQALVERINNFPKAGALRTAPSLGALLSMPGTSATDNARNSSLPFLTTGCSATTRTLDELLASEPDMSDMFDWPPSLSSWKGQGEEMVDVDGIRSNLSSPETYDCSAAASNHLPSMETLHSLGATSDIDDLDVADEDTDANDDFYLPFDEKRRRTDSPVTKRQSSDRAGSPPSSSATEAVENKRLKKRNMFQSPPINEVVKLLGLSGRWRKYGRKVMKDCPYPAHYYKCAVPGCDAKRKVWYDENEVLQMQGKGDDHTHAPLTKSEVLGHHRVRRRRSSASPTHAPDDSHSPSSSASDGGTESFYSTADSQAGGAKSSGGNNNKSCGGAQKQKRVAWPRLPNPRWRFRRCTPDVQTTTPGNNSNVKSQGQSSEGLLALEPRREVNNQEGEDKGRKKMPEWPLGGFAASRQLALGGSGGESPLANLDLSCGIALSARGSDSCADTSLADSRPGGALGLGGLYDWQEKADDQMLIFTPVFGRQHSWRRLRRQFSSDLMQSFDATGL